MEKPFTFQLISGQFLPTDGTQILLSLINSKIKYHSLENFSSEIRFDNVNSNGKMRIEALQEASNVVTVLAAEAQKSGMRLQISSIVTITLVS